MRRTFTLIGAAVALVAMLIVSAETAHANVALTTLSIDPYTNITSAHQTQVEPDTFAFGSTVVTSFQSGRFFDGGSTNLGWATSSDGGTNWTNGFLPGITLAAGGSYDRASDPSVAYDAAHGRWLITSLVLTGTAGAGILVNSSINGGTTWGNPVAITTMSGVDKEWVVCDNTVSSPFYGHCYAEWDDNSAGNLIYMSTSADGGSTWSTPVTTADQAGGIGGQPLVQVNGTVIVPIDNINETAVLSFRSTNGGTSWSSSVTVAGVSSHKVAGSLRAGPLISAQVDGSGKVYVAWHDCRFETSCKANDIVLSTSADGITWSAVSRVPIDRIGSHVDHFLPGLGVDRATSGTTAHVGLTYYYYPTAGCSTSGCRLDVGFVSSANGGATWGAATQLAGPMKLRWLPSTSEGFMVGDYIATVYSNGAPRTVFAVAAAPSSSSVLHEAMFTPNVSLHSGLPLVAGETSGTGVPNEAGAPAPPAATALTAH